LKSILTIAIAIVALGFVTNQANAQTSKNNARLKAALKQFPEADLNKDGVLTLQEAIQFGRNSGAIPNETPSKTTSKNVPKQKSSEVQKSTFQGWTHYKDVQYDTKHERNVLDFYQAKSQKPTPVVMYFHGGGFRQGDKKSVHSGRDAMLKAYLKAGISVAACNYPFLKDANYMQIMQHCARSVQFVRSKQKDWNIDSRRFGAYGESAGALISDWLAYSPDIAKRSSKDPIARLTKSLAVVASHMQPMGTDSMVLRYMKRGGPPIFIYSNTPPSDKVHDPKFSKMMKAQADRVGITAVLIGGGRNDIPKPPNGENPVDLQVKFFNKYFGVKAAKK
jgi:acetyl esterase/lipase